ncbi:fatty acid catabolic regulatory protein, partial [Metarhizium brunneum ARSEF 3297]
MIAPSLPTNQTEVRHMSPPETPDGAHRARVVRACVRCRKQKLKVSFLASPLFLLGGLNFSVSNGLAKRKCTLLQCDTARPCTLCRRSGFPCEARDENGSAKIKRAVRRAKRDPIPPDSASPEQKKHNLPLNPSRASPPFQSNSPGQSQGPHGNLSERQRFGANSSAVGFAARMFGDSAGSHPSDISKSIPGYAGRSKMGCAGPPWSLVTMQCPSPVLLEALIDVYFDRMHWFTLVFHEPSFRQAAKHVLSRTSWHRDELGFVLACLMVSAVGLKCVVRDPSWIGHAMLAEESWDAVTLLEALIKEVRFHLLDLLDDCSIETVQVCSLLGTYYVFHASPTLAWSILGMAVRTAYALTLHCDGDDDSATGKDYDPVVAQVRRRNWNHILVADTFAAMIYGRPVSLDAAFSYVQPLDDLDDLVLGPGLSKHPLLTANSPRSVSSRPVSRQTFHELKYYLYDIVREALNRFRLLRLQSPISPAELVSLVEAVQHVRSLLYAWKADLPAVFDTNPTSQEAILADLDSIPDLSPEEQKSRRHLSLQINALNVTYNSAVIFIHRPLLEYRVAADSRQALSSETLQVVSESLQLSVNAALEMSRVPVPHLENQFAMSFVLMNFFTAGVILCIPPTTWPLSSIAHEAKAGTLRIIHASRALKPVTPIASHTEQLLTGLLRRSLQQEVDSGLHQEHNVRIESDRRYPASMDQTMRYSQQNHLPIQNETEARNEQANQVPVQQAPRFSQADRQGPISGDQMRMANVSLFPLTHNGEMEDANVMHSASTIYDENGNLVISNNDPRRGAIDYHYAEQRHQVDSQLDEVFGIFGQSK